MAGVPLEDHFSSTDDIQGYAHIHSDSQQVSEELKLSVSPLSGKKDERRALGESTNPRSRQEAEGCPGHIYVKVTTTTEQCWPRGTREHIGTAAHVSREWLMGRKVPQEPKASIQPGPA